MYSQKLVDLLSSRGHFLLIHKVFHFDYLDSSVVIRRFNLVDEITLVIDKQVVIPRCLRHKIIGIFVLFLS